LGLCDDTDSDASEAAAFRLLIFASSTCFTISASASATAAYIAFSNSGVSSSTMAGAGFSLVSSWGN